MGNEKVKISSEIQTANFWYNFTDEKGRKIGITEKDGKNPELKKVMDLAKIGDEIEGNLVEKDGKFYMFDKKTDNNGTFKKPFTATPKDKSFEAAIAAANAVAVLYANKDAQTLAGLPKAFETIHGLIMAKATTPAATTEQKA